MATRQHHRIREWRIGGSVAALALGLGWAGAVRAVARGSGDWDEDTVPPAVSQRPGSDFDSLDLAELLMIRMPVVESATQRKQSLYEAPSSITVFDHDEIVAAGLTSIADILRRVPGLYVMPMNGNIVDTGMRGVNRPANNSVVLLVDGRRTSTWIDSPFWESFPVHVGEIDRIEVLRGPGATMYGADALTGVINIVTRRPLDHPNPDGLFAAGNTYLPKAEGTFGGARVSDVSNGFLSYTVANARGTLASRAVANWNHMPAWVPPQGDNSLHYHGDFGFHGGLATEWRPSPLTSLYLEGRHGQSEATRRIVGAGLDSVWESIRDDYVGAVFRRDALLPSLDLKANADVQHMVLDVNAATDIPGERLHIMADRWIGHGMAQADLALLGGRNTVSLGAESTSTRIAQAGPALSRYHNGVMIQNETRLFDRPRILLNLAARSDWTSVDVDGSPRTTYASLNPRVSLIARLNPRHSLRIMYATAYRIPDLYEAGADFHYSGGYSPPVPPVYIEKPNPSLRPERVRSVELGYRGKPLHWLNVDAVGYYQKLNDEIRLLRPMWPAEWENTSPKDQMGIELGLKLRPARWIGGYLSYGLTRARDTSTGARAPFFPTHLLAVGGDVTLGGFRLGADFNYIGPTRNYGVEMTQQAQLVMANLPVPAQPVLNLRAGYPLPDRRVEIFVMANNTLAPWRGRVMPTTGAEPSGAIFLAGIRLTDAPVTGVQR
jgi:outer membrane receptor protein involved in Fe transport